MKSLHDAGVGCEWHCAILAAMLGALKVHPEQGPEAGDRAGPRNTQPRRCRGRGRGPCGDSRYFPGAKNYNEEQM